MNQCKASPTLRIATLSCLIALAALALPMAASAASPTITSISPTSATAGGALFTLDVYGANYRQYTNPSVVRWNGSSRTTTYVSSTHLQASITAADIASAGTAAVTVYTPSGTNSGTSGSVTFTINPYSVSGTVTCGGTGVAGVTMTITGTGTTTLTGSDGSYTISGLSGSHTVTPSLAGCTFSPSVSTSFSTTATRNFTATYTVSGYVTLSGGAGVNSVTVTISSAGHTTTNSSGYYSYPTLSSPHTVTPTLSGYVFVPASAPCDANDTTINFTAYPTYTVSGTVSSGSSNLSGVTMTFSGFAAGDGTVSTSGSGDNYTRTGVAGSGTVTPSLAGYTFTPASRTISSGTTGADFTATYAISGTVTSGGSNLSGVSIAVTGSGGGDTTTSTNSSGAYTVSGLTGSHTVTPTLSGYTFSPTSTDVTAAATCNFTGYLTYAVSGTVSSGGSNLSGVTMTFSGFVAGNGTPTTSGPSGANYSQTGVAGSGTVTPSLLGYTFSPTSRTISSGTTTADFTATAATYTGQCTVQNNGNGVQNVLVTYSGFTTGDGTALTNTSGVCSKSVSGSGTVTPVLSGWAFSPTSDTLSFSDQSASFTATFTISGTVTSGGVALGGVAVSASGPGSDGNATTAANGTYTISGLSGSKTVTPTLSGYTFSPTTHSSITGPTSGVDFTATYAISGTVSLSGAFPPDLSGVTMTVTGTGGGDTTTTTSYGIIGFGDNYSISGLSGPHTVTPSLAGYVFSPTSRDFTGPSSSLDFTATATYAVSGTVTCGGTGVQGVVVTITGTGGGTATTDANGAYTISGLTGSHSMSNTSAVLAGYAFTVSSTSSFSSAATRTFTATYAISGTVTSGGAPLAGVSVSTGTGAGNGSATTAADGTYTITGLTGTKTVTPTLSGYTFAPATRTGITGPTSGVDFVGTYTVTGKVTSGGFGLVGVTITLSGGGSGTATTLADGTYSVAGAGGSTTVTPTLAGYTFTQPSASVTFGTRTNVNFTATYTVSGTVKNGAAGLGGVTITLTGAGGGGGTTTTAPDGSYSIGGLTVNHTVTPSLSGYTFTPTSRDVTGPTTTCDFDAGLVVTTDNLVYCGDTTNTPGSPATLKAALTSGTTPGGPGIPGATVQFVVGGFSCAATTNASGVATATVPANTLVPGTYHIYCTSLAGATYPAATADGQLVVSSPNLTDTQVAGSVIWKHSGFDCTLKFGFSVNTGVGTLAFLDKGTGTTAMSPVGATVVMSNDGRTATITGTCTVNNVAGQPLVLQVTDKTNSVDSFKLGLNGGTYSASPGTVPVGAISITTN